MYHPTANFWWGAACGAGIALSAFYTLWLVHQYTALSPYGRPRHSSLDLRGIVAFGLSTFSLLLVAIVTALPSHGGPPHLTWIAGVLLGIAAPPALRWLWRHRRLTR